ncbi:MAG: hypothetical protein ACO377_10735, partial [Pseudomonadales bacterium]
MFRSLDSIMAKSMPPALRLFGTRWALSGAILVGALAATNSAPAADGGTDSAMQGYREVADLYVVDCLLPGQVRRLGQRTFLTPRRPTRTTAA